MGFETFAYYAAKNLIFLEKNKKIMYGAPRFSPVPDRWSSREIRCQQISSGSRRDCNFRRLRFGKQIRSRFSAKASVAVISIKMYSKGAQNGSETFFNH